MNMNYLAMNILLFIPYTKIIFDVVVRIRIVFKLKKKIDNGIINGCRYISFRLIMKNTATTELKPYKENEELALAFREHVRIVKALRLLVHAQLSM
jgi:hypothetical protein